jgi:hypothetical protein
MDIPGKRDWLNVSTIGAPLWILVSFAFGLFVVHPGMSPQFEFLWGAATVAIAFIVWFGAAKTQQRAREDREQARENRERLDTILELLPKPETTKEDIRMAATGISDRLSNTPLASSAAQAEIHKWWNNP